MVFNPDTRLITGSPTIGTNILQTVFYRVTDANGDDAEQWFNVMTIVDVPVSFGAQTIMDQVLMFGEIAAVNLPATLTGNEPYVYTLTPDLPAGLVFHAGAEPNFQGTPTADFAATEYTFGVTDADGDTAELMFDLSVVSTVSIRAAKVPANAVNQAAADSLTAANFAPGTFATESETNVINIPTDVPTLQTVAILLPAVALPTQLTYRFSSGRTLGPHTIGALGVATNSSDGVYGIFSIDLTVDGLTYDRMILLQAFSSTPVSSEAQTVTLTPTWIS